MPDLFEVVSAVNLTIPSLSTVQVISSVDPKPVAFVGLNEIEIAELSPTFNVVLLLVRLMDVAAIYLLISKLDEYLLISTEPITTSGVIVSPLNDE